MKATLVRLLALTLIVVGWMGALKHSFKRTYSAQLSFTIPKATVSDIDAIFADTVRGFHWGQIARVNNGAAALEVNFQGSSWNEVNQFQNQFSTQIGRVLTERKLTLQSTSSSSSGYVSETVLAGRGWFLGSAAVILFGAAMLILSLRIFGGGNRDGAPLQDAESA